MQPTTHYAKSSDIHIAYQVFGEGPDLVMAPGFVSHIENYWDEPRFARWLNRLGSFCRVVLFDKRGTGLSDRVAYLPPMDERMDDVRAVMDAVGIERAVQFGISEGGSLATLFAASHPKRTNSLIVYGGFARFVHWIATDEGFEELINYIDTRWGSGAGLPHFAPKMAGDLALQQWWGKFERLGANPAAAMALMRMNREIDLTGILHSVKVPTLIFHLAEDTLVSVEGGRELAAGIPGAKLVEMPGTDHIPFLEAGDRLLEEMEEFVTGSHSVPVVDRVLSTVMFTDIVARPSRPAPGATWLGAIFSKPTTRQCDASSLASAGRKLSLSATASWPRSTARRGPSTAPTLSASHCAALTFLCASACTPARSSWQRTTCAASRCTSPRAWPTSVALTTFSSRARSRTWSRALVLGSKISAHIP